MARPRNFDRQKTLMSVKAVFWEKGFEATSMRNLELATGLRMQSIVGCFGNKQALYLKALNDYWDRELTSSLSLLAAACPPAERFSGLFGQIIDRECKSDPRGCFLCNAAIDRAQIGQEASQRVNLMIDRMFGAFSSALMIDEFYESNQTERDETAALLLTTYFGLQALSKADIHPRLLENAAKAAIAQLYLPDRA